MQNDTNYPNEYPDSTVVMLELIWGEGFMSPGGESHVHADHLPHAVIIDCTADQGVADRYAGWLERGIHIVTPNKKAFSATQAYYEELRAAAAG